MWSCYTCMLQNPGRYSLQFSSVAQSCLTLCNPWTAAHFPVYHQFPELAQTHIHQVSDTIQPSYPLSSPSPPAFHLSQNQGLFQWVSYSHQVAKVLSFSFSWSTYKEYLGLIPLGMTGLISLKSKGLSRVFSNTTVWSINYTKALSLFYGPTFTSIYDYWKNHSSDETDLCLQSNVSAF